MNAKKICFVVVLAICLVAAVCGMTACTHTHTLKWESNAEGHWRVCTKCDYKGETEEHFFREWTEGDNGKTRKCGYCLYTETLAEHNTALWAEITQKTRSLGEHHRNK